MTAPPQVLVIGLDPRRVPGPWDPQPVLDALAQAAAAFQAHGVAMTECLFGLDGSDDVEAVVTGALRSSTWDCVVVGGGIRKPEELLELFERVVNLVRVHAPTAAIAFNSAPGDTYDAAARCLARADRTATWCGAPTLALGRRRPDARLRPLPGTPQ